METVRRFHLPSRLSQPQLACSDQEPCCRARSACGSMSAAERSRMHRARSVHAMSTITAIPVFTTGFLAASTSCNSAGMHICWSAHPPARPGAAFEGCGRIPAAVVVRRVEHGRRGSSPARHSTPLPIPSHWEHARLCAIIFDLQSAGELAARFGRNNRQRRTDFRPVKPPNAKHWKTTRCVRSNSRSSFRIAATDHPLADEC